MKLLSISLMIIGLCFSITDISAQCADCDDLACFTCDPTDLQNGITATMPICAPFPCPVQSGQPNPLCSPGLVPNNISWIPFVASDESLSISLELFNCGGPGVQFGVYESCDFNDCIYFEENCVVSNSEFVLDNLNIGRTYYFWIDGCSGTVCEYIFSIPELSSLSSFLPEIDAVTAYSPCRDAVLTDNFGDPSNPSNASISGNCETASSITVCPGELLDFSVIHQGGSTSNISQLQDPCDQYLEDQDADFHWSTNWAGSFTFNPAEDATFIDPLEMPQAEGVYTICLDLIETECSVVAGPVCLDINVVAIPSETYEYQVCAEDLEFGWDPSLGGDDPNGDGYAWLGGSDIDLQEVLSWPQNGDNYHCNSFIFFDPECECEVTQELCILPVGNLEYTELDLYMFRSQFEDCDPISPLDCNPEAYVWTWDWNGDDEEIDLDGPLPPDTMTQQMFFRIEGYSHFQEDWSGSENYCDTLLAVTVTVKDPPIIIDSLGCGAFGVEFDFDTYYNQTGAYRQYPPIDHDSIQFSFVDCATGNVYSMSTGIAHYTQFSNPISNYCINMTYEHTDGAWWDWENQEHTHGSGEVPITQTTTTYGPYDYNLGGSISPPQVTGPTSICDSNLNGHVYSIVNPLPGQTYIWNMNPVVPGVVVTDISSVGDGSMVSIDLPTSFTANDCINVVSSFSCGVSAPELICISFSSSPITTINPTEDICVSGAPSPNAITTAVISADVSPAGSNYVYTWNINGSSTTTLTNSTTYSFPSPGSQSVSVSVSDTISGCSSVVSSPITFDVIEPLATPILNCTFVSAFEITVSWNSIPGAAGYIVLVDGIIATNAMSTDLEYRFMGLNPGEQVTASVIAVGPDPCFNSAPSTNLVCVTTTEVDNDGDGSLAGTDCDDNDPNNYPGNVEICDGQDNNCDGVVDEGIDQLIVNCTGSGIDYVAFDWNNISGATNYTLSTIINDGPSTTTIVTASDFVIANLNPDDEVCVEVAVNSLNSACVAPYTTCCIASSCELYPPLAFNACEELADRITFSWDPIPGIEMYEILDSWNGFTFIQSATSYTIDNLMENRNVSITVTPIHPTFGCAIASSEITCTSLCVSRPQVELSCANASGEFIQITWDPVPGAVINYSVCLVGITVDTYTQTDTEITLSNLVPGESAEFSVSANFANGCSTEKSSIICSTTTVIDNDGDGSPAGTDCDDNNPNNFPGNTEICDGQDNNCNDIVDEGFDNTALLLGCATSTDSTITINWNELADAQVYYVYIDGAFTSSSDTTDFTITGLNADQTVEVRIDAVFTNGCPIKSTTVSCTASSTIIDVDGDGIPSDVDCDDNDANNFPGNTEICDEADNNCDGQIDEGLPVTTYYSDSDGDGYGVDSTGFDACLQPPDTTTEAGDCDDTDPDINPSAIEIPGNGIDEDCDGEDGGVATHELGGYSLNIFPNPVSNFLIVDTALENLSYKLLSIDGRLIQAGYLAKRQIDVTALESGSYLVIIKSDVYNQQIVERIVKR